MSKDVEDQINPLDIPSADLPLIVLSDDIKSIVAWATVVRTNGDYGHIMEMVRPGVFASQQPDFFKNVKPENYMKDSMRIKFWQPIFTDEEKEKYIAAVEKDLAYVEKKPQFLKYIFGYDRLGIVGQLFGVRWLNNPWSFYCSERVARHLRVVFKDVPLHESPVGMNKWFKNNPDKFRVYGYRFPLD